MGFLGDLVDDVLSVPSRVLRAGNRLICSHRWTGWRWSERKERYVRSCVDCGAEEEQD